MLIRTNIPFIKGDTPRIHLINYLFRTSDEEACVPDDPIIISRNFLDELRRALAVSERYIYRSYPCKVDVSLIHRSLLREFSLKSILALENFHANFVGRLRSLLFEISRLYGE